MGPVGSGKSTLVHRDNVVVLQQPVSPLDNTRHSRFVIVRNSYPELRTTTIKTWLEIFDEADLGTDALVATIDHHIQLPQRKVGRTRHGSHFLALDTPKDVVSCYLWN